jgi:hypothetical protein
LKSSFMMKKKHKSCKNICLRHCLKAYKTLRFINNVNEI